MRRLPPLSPLPEGGRKRETAHNFVGGFLYNQNNLMTSYAMRKKKKIASQPFPRREVVVMTVHGS